MADELQALLDRIDRDGIQRGEAEKEKIVAEAKIQAAAIVDEAQKKATKMVADAKAETEMMRQKSEEAMRQSGRQILLEVRNELQSRVQGAVSSLLKVELHPNTVAEIIMTLCTNYLEKQGNEENLAVLVPAGQLEALASAVKAKLAENLRERVSLAPSKALANGFKLSFSGSDVLYDFSDEALTEAIAAHLSPTLGAILMKA
jgi:V/A-type H+-transporting ATPase subunit E